MFQIISDGSCDLSAEQAREAGIAVVPFYVSVDGVSYRKERVELDVHDFYEYCVRHPDMYPRTSMPTVQDYADIFEHYLSRGMDILCYCITEKFSGSFNSAMSAKALLEPEYPDNRISVINSTVVTAAQSLLLLELARYARAGHSYEETLARGEEIKETADIYFTIDNLSYLAKGGRIGKLASLAAKSMNLKPLIRFAQGELHPMGVTIGRKRSFAKVAEYLKKAITEKGVSPERYAFALGWGYDREEARPFFQCVKGVFQELFGVVPEFVPVQIGATIGVHTGPYPVGIGFIEKSIL